MKRKESPEEFYERRKKERGAANRRVMRMTALVMQLGITMLTCLLLCGIPGRLLAGRTGHPVIFPLFLLLGILAGFRSCYQVIERFYGRLGTDRQAGAGQETEGRGALPKGAESVSAEEAGGTLAAGGKDEDEDELDEDPWI